MKPASWADMHTHTSASDGDLGPAQLVDAALRQGLRAVAITDHDTVEGVPEALARGERRGFHVIPGVELAVEAENGQTFHLLGYNFDITHDELCTTLARLQRARFDRNDRLMARLAKLGLPVKPETLSKYAKGGQIGRPHFAKAMVELGYVRSPDEAFLRYLRRGAPAYEDKFRLAPENAVELIRRVGGVPVMAHPHTLGFESPLELEACVSRLVRDAGLMGIEVLYPDCDPEQQNHYRYLAEKYDLVMTGGTDFHGSVKPGILLGWGRGDLRVPYAWVQRVVERSMDVS